MLDTNAAVSSFCLVHTRRQHKTTESTNQYKSSSGGQRTCNPHDVNHQIKTVRLFPLMLSSNARAADAETYGFSVLALVQSTPADDDSSDGRDADDDERDGDGHQKHVAVQALLLLLLPVVVMATGCNKRQR